MMEYHRQTICNIIGEPPKRMIKVEGFVLKLNLRLKSNDIYSIITKLTLGWGLGLGLGFGVWGLWFVVWG